MVISNNRNGVAKWLDDFAATLKSKQGETEQQSLKQDSDQQDNDQQEKLALINVKDLEKLVWNDETFYVMFDEFGATVINEFGNTVTTLQDAFDIDAVDTILNSKQIIATEEDEDGNLDFDDFEEEIKKVSSYYDLENDVTPETDSPDNEADNDFVLLKISSLENKINELQKTIEALSIQEHARRDPGNVFDNDSQGREQEHYHETAQTTQNQIDAEKEIDLTTPKGRYELSEQGKVKITDEDIESGIGELAEEIEDFIENIDEDIANEDKTSQDNIGKLDHNISESISEDVINEDGVSDDICEEASISDEETEIEEADENEESDKEVKVASLNVLGTRDSNIFKHGICIKCGENTLVKHALIDSFVKVSCNSCGEEYGVNIETEEIFKQN